MFAAAAVSVTFDPTQIILLSGIKVIVGVIALEKFTLAIVLVTVPQEFETVEK